jgi:hypothetical protein
MNAGTGNGDLVFYSLLEMLAVDIRTIHSHESMKS